MAFTFEDKYIEINVEIEKRRNKWTLTSLAWLDFEDVAQILRIHIHKKWHLYDQLKPLAPWVNVLISHQIRNLIRNNYSNYTRPCLRCAASEGENTCRIYGLQCNDCPLYKYWETNKKVAYDIKLPVTIENHLCEVQSIHNDDIDTDHCSEKLHAYMLKNLKPLEAKIYRWLYIEHKSEIEVAKLMGYKTSEKGRNPGYKRIKNMKNEMLRMAKNAIYNEDIDLHFNHGKQ